ncbi:MAG TPA: PH domain-containing protein [Pyrinomonadaceae bacterium]|nr:PH domain-containing protein [Pyrinomonadaceae bacterium]
MIYKSKKDWWLFGLVWGAVLVPLAVGLFNVLSGDAQLGWTLVRVGVGTGAAVVFTTYPLDYEIASDELVARSGFMRWRVPLGSIQEVGPSRNPASAPAWSLDRLRIEYVKNGATRSLYVSPLDKEGFLRELADSAPGLEVRGGRVVRG